MNRFCDGVRDYKGGIREEITGNLVDFINNVESHGKRFVASVGNEIDSDIRGMIICDDVMYLDFGIDFNWDDEDIVLHLYDNDGSEVVVCMDMSKICSVDKYSEWLVKNADLFVKIVDSF